MTALLITATVTDANGEQATASVTVDVLAGEGAEGR